MTLPQPDQRIVEAASQGDEHAFSRIVQAYQQQILNYVYRLTGDRALAEDLTQEVFLRAYQSLPSFRGQCLFTTWLFQITKNRVIDEKRADERRPRFPAPLDELRDHPLLDPPAERGETVDALWHAVSALDVRLKMPLLLRDVVGFSYLEISYTLEVDIGTVKWRIYKAREAVQHALEVRGLSPGFAAAGERARPRAGLPTATPARV